jgi:hypothetical protein
VSQQARIAPSWLHDSPTPSLRLTLLLSPEPEPELSSDEFPNGSEPFSLPESSECDAEHAPSKHAIANAERTRLRMTPPLAATATS